MTCLLLACGDPEKPTDREDTPLPGPGLPEITVTYTGTLPCIDCQGIRTRLKLIPDSLTYSLEENYVGSSSGDSAKSQHGIYQIEYGLGDDSLAVIFRLDPETDHPRFFLQLGDTALEQLDNQRARTANAEQQRLRK